MKQRRIVLGGALAALGAGVFTFVRSLSPVPVVVDPSFVSAGEAGWLGGGDLVLGVVLDGVAKAYPIPAIAPLEYLNDRVGRTPVGVSW